MSTLDYDFSNGVARLTMAAGDRGNALDLESTTALLEGVRGAHADGARVIVLRSRGRFFCVGGDVAGFAAADDLPLLVDDLAEMLHRVVSELAHSPAVVVSAVQGPAAGAGFALAAAADIVVAAESASFTLAYTRLGLSHDGSSTLLVHSLGLHRVLQLVLLNDRISAAEAQAAGLVARVVPDDELEAATETVVDTLLAGSAPAFAAAKRLMRETAERNPESVMRREALSIRALAATPDGQEGVAAFAEKRPARFGGS
ncbi:enoyl-CoA hydratase/isomerase family protein [Nocardioides nanhaiensis]|uniref:Enoyl-CoA hydratase-related protein n=1 Tax=Nocardioides nanhaiensis TaxID=1476871 RepID=A0ABP8WFG8_9ACTN